MISREEVQHIASLARLELSDTEIEKMQKDLSSILDYFDLLKKAPVPDKTTKEIKEIYEVTRKDEVFKKSGTLDEKLITLAPDKKDGYIRVKNIL
jgi:aspartyl-tRNA(Asn)/glutamyl-tRNA(Gln) amidotransferase subunit C